MREINTKNLTIIIIFSIVFILIGCNSSANKNEINFKIVTSDTALKVTKLNDNQYDEILNMIRLHFSSVWHETPNFANVNSIAHISEVRYAFEEDKVKHYYCVFSLNKDKFFVFFSGNELPQEVELESFWDSNITYKDFESLKIGISTHEDVNKLIFSLYKDEIKKERVEDSFFRLQTSIGEPSNDFPRDESSIIQYTNDGILLIGFTEQGNKKIVSHIERLESKYLNSIHPLDWE